MMKAVNDQMMRFFRIKPEKERLGKVLVQQEVHSVSVQAKRLRRPSGGGRLHRYVEMLAVRIQPIRQKKALPFSLSCSAPKEKAASASGSACISSWSCLFLFSKENPPHGDIGGIALRMDERLAQFLCKRLQ
ncbi:hypothetical protein ACLBWT_05175 [Paenibacillus sp. D51F]